MSDKPQEPTLQERMKATMGKAGIPYKKIDVFGSHIIVTSWSHDAATRWARLIARFATVQKAAHESVDEAKRNKGTVLRPTMVKVWRTYGVIK